MKLLKKMLELFFFCLMLVLILPSILAGITSAAISFIIIIPFKDGYVTTIDFCKDAKHKLIQRAVFGNEQKRT